MMPCLCALICPRTHSEVEALSLVLIGSSLHNVCLAHVGVRGSRFDRLSGLAVREGLRHIKVLHCEHVLKGLHGGVQSLPHLTHTQHETCDFNLTKYELTITLIRCAVQTKVTGIL